MLEWREAPGSPLLARFSIIAPAKVPVRELLERHGIAPRKRLGQNFLHDPAVARRIVAAVGAGPGERVLEIGPGLGALTLPLLEAGARVRAVEVDPRVAAFLQAELSARTRFELLRADVLEVDLEELGRSAVLVANLPYSITGPFLARLVDHAGTFRRCVIMVQREVATRLTASAGGKEIGAPTVLLRLLYRVERLFDVGRGAFFPPPDVASSVLRLTPIRGARVSPAVRNAVNLAYRHRRKMLRKTLRESVAGEDDIARALVAIGRPDTARPEHLEPEDWPRLLARACEDVS